LRPLARPIHEYTAPKQGVVHGVLCGFTANGTNPDVVVALEAVKTDGKESWRYAVICMTASGVAVNLDKAEAFNRPYARNPKEYEGNVLLDAGIWRLGTEGRATALVTIEIYLEPNGSRILAYEFLSLTGQKFALKHKTEKIRWDATDSALKLKDLPDAPKPAA